MSELPEYLQDQTEEAIRERMLAQLPSELEKIEGSPPWDALAPVAIELTLAAEWAKEVLRRGFAATTFGVYLDLRAEEHGVTRLAATPARTPDNQFKVTGSPGASLPAGYTVSTASSETSPAILFTVVDTISLDDSGVGWGTVAAVSAGKDGNVPAGAIKHLTNPVSGILSVTNLFATTGGLDEEDDTGLLNRYHQRVRSSSVGGNKMDYINWALEVPGVGHVIVIPVWAGGGTVKVVIVDSYKRPASPTLVDQVQQYIDPIPGQGAGKAPIGAAVTVVSATPVTISVSANVIRSGDKSLAEVASAFELALESHLQNIAFSSDPSVKYVRIGSLLLEIDGVQDYSKLLINGETKNVTIGSDEVAVKGTVSLT